jgi:hypothetical protein
MNLEHKIIDHIYNYEYALFTYATMIGKREFQIYVIYYMNLNFLVVRRSSAKIILLVFNN